MEFSGEWVVARLSGEIDHCVAGPMREEIDSAVLNRNAKGLVLDFGQVEFMDSSGIGLVMGRYKKLKELGGEVVVQNTSAPIRKVMRMAGLNKLVRFCENEDREAVPVNGNTEEEDKRYV